MRSQDRALHYSASCGKNLGQSLDRLLVTSPKVHWSEGSQVRKVTGLNSNPNAYPNPYHNHNPIPNPKVVFDLRNKETLNTFSYVHAKAIEKFGLVTLRASEPSD